MFGRQKSGQKSGLAVQAEQVMQRQRLNAEALAAGERQRLRDRQRQLIRLVQANIDQVLPVVGAWSGYLHVRGDDVYMRCGSQGDSEYGGNSYYVDLRTGEVFSIYFWDVDKKGRLVDPRKAAASWGDTDGNIVRTLASILEKAGVNVPDEAA